VADRVSELAGDDVSQQAVGYWETGKVDLRKVHPRRLAAYANVLRISLSELAEAVGHEVKELFPDMEFDSTARRSGPPIPPVAPRIEIPLEIPEQLQEVIDAMGHKPGYEKLRSEKALRALTALRNYLGPDEGPQNADQWLEYFLNMRQWLPK